MGHEFLSGTFLPENIACVAGAKRGGRGGGRKARKRGKGRERLL